MENAHSAEVDINATIEVLESQLVKYEQLVTTVDSILTCVGEEKMIDYARRFSYNDKDVAVFNFGKYKDQSVSECFKKDGAYYDWMMKGDFPMHTKKKATELFNNALLKKKPMP